MKKLLIKLSIFIALIALIILPVSISVDPYNVFHYENPRDNGIESNKGFIKTKYMIKNHEGIDGLVFGSSRAGFVDIGYLEQKTNSRFYDMASSESLVKEQTKELKILIKNGFIPKKVWIFVDDISCFVDPALHENMLYRVPYPEKGILDEAEFYLKYTDLLMVKDSMKIINDNELKKSESIKTGVDPSFDTSTKLDYITRYHTTGTERLDKVSRFDPNEKQYQEGYWVDYYNLRVDEAVEDMKEMVNLCNEYGIELTVLTNPLYHLTYKLGIENGYLQYLKALASVTDYYNFSGFSEVTENYQYYYETSHFTPEVTRMMIDSVLDDNVANVSDTEVFGIHVTNENVDTLIHALEQQAVERGIQLPQ